MKRRKAIDVVEHLRARMDAMVTDYDLNDPRSAQRVPDVIDGTAFFPGGHGLWRGRERHGPLPEFFPDAPVMFVGHNFDAVASHLDSTKRGIEDLTKPTWTHQIEYLKHAKHPFEECFFTNALMGLQPGKALGDMVTTALFREQCRRFLCEQIDIVRPRLIVGYGKVAVADLKTVSRARGAISMLHPYRALFDNAAAEREGKKLRDALDALPRVVRL